MKKSALQRSSPDPNSLGTVRYCSSLIFINVVGKYRYLINLTGTSI